MRKDTLTGLIDALKSRELTPTRFTWDSSTGELVGLEVQPVAVQGEQEQEEKERKELPRRPVSAISSLKMKHPDWSNQ